MSLLPARVRGFRTDLWTVPPENERRRVGGRKREGERAQWWDRARASASPAPPAVARLARRLLRKEAVLVELDLRKRQRHEQQRQERADEAAAAEKVVRVVTACAPAAAGFALRGAEGVRGGAAACVTTPRRDGVCVCARGGPHARRHDQSHGERGIATTPTTRKNKMRTVGELKKWWDGGDGQRMGEKPPASRTMIQQVARPGAGLRLYTAVCDRR
jgi:hypothetical protein